MDWLGVVLLLISVCLLTIKKRTGWLFGIAGDCSWLIFGIQMKIKSLILINLIFIILCFYGWINWKKKSNERKMS